MKKIDFYLDNFRRFNKRFSSLDDHKLLYCWAEEIYCAARFGCSPDDYFRYEFYKKSDSERNKFITYKRSRRIIRTFNRGDVSILEDKAKFNTFFSDYIHREWIDLRRAGDGDFEKFLEKHGKIILKPVEGGQGKGIFSFSREEYHKGFLDEHRSYIAEEILVQHPAMAQLNPSCVNSVRILTFKNTVIACALRIGGDHSLVDNLHSNGICAHLDLETGVVDTLCVDNQMNRYLYHPLNGMCLVGFKIPNWEILKAAAVEASRKLPDIQYIGWDVAVLEDKAALIEGNHDPGHDVVQMIAQTGLYDKIKELAK